MQDPPAALLDIVRVKDEPVDFGFQQLGLHALEGFNQPPETTPSTANSILVTVKDEPDEATEVDPPMRPRRVVMDFVLLPTIAEVQRKKKEDEDDLRKLKYLFKVCSLTETRSYNPPNVSSPHSQS